MSVDEPYAAGLRDYFHLKTPARAVARALRKSRFVVTHVGSDQPDLSPATPVPIEDAFILNLHRKDFIAHELSLDGRSVPVVPFPKGMMSLVHLALDPTPYPGSVFECSSFYLRRDSFDRLADDLGGNRIDDLAIKPGVAINDPVVANLGPCLLPSIEQPERVNTLFLDHVAMALHTHLAQRYGGMRIPRTSGSGSLTPWQLRLARDTMNAHLDGGISLARVASDCGLSVSHFAKAFTRSTGVPPHRWLMQRRVDRAKDLMRVTTTPLAEVALACGFSDQCHFTRVFSQATGTTPSQWRRLTCVPSSTLNGPTNWAA
jgi:AraC-like DNA-binding protein